MNIVVIVTSFALKTHPIGAVWGGTLAYPADKLDALINATAEYSTNCSLNEPKAIMVTQLYANNGTVTGGVSDCRSRQCFGLGTNGCLVLFYDGPKPLPGLFDSFLDFPGIGGETKTHETFSLFADDVEVAAEIDNRYVLVHVHDICLTFSSAGRHGILLPS
jgi:hypothetical protein